MNNTSEIRRILFAGLNTVDLQFLIKSYPEANTKTRALDRENAAVTCAYLGSRVDLCTPIGSHFFSEFILRDLSAINIRLLDPREGTACDPVFSSIYTSQQYGERTVVYYQPENMLVADFNLALDLKDYSLILFDGYYPEIALDIAKKAKEKGISIVLDGGSWKPCLNELLRFTDIAICSHDFRPPGTDDEMGAFDFLHSKGVSSAAITRGEKNIFYSSGGSRSEIEIKPVPAVDTLGAGDILHGAFCHYFNQGYDFKDSLVKASEIAGKSCKYFGTRSWMR